jgi:hypothetical protein
MTPRRLAPGDEVGESRILGQENLPAEVDRVVVGNGEALMVKHGLGRTGTPSYAIPIGGPFVTA